MKMTVSVNNQSGVPYVQYGTDRQKAKATKFVNADNQELNNLAYKITDRKHRDKKFSINVARAIMATPVIAGVAAAITTKGKVSAKTLAGTKSFVKNAVELAVPVAVLSAHNKMVANSPKTQKAEAKHPLLTLTGLVGVATGAVMATDMAMAKISPKAAQKLKSIGKTIKLDKLASKMDAAPTAIKTTMGKLADKISLPKGVKERLSSLTSKIKMPQILKDGYKKIAELNVTQNVAKGMKNAGKAMLKNPVTTTFGVIGAVLIGNAVKNTLELTATKNKLKDAQMKTATNLINAYAAENESLKAANAKAADSLEKANVIVAEDAQTENKSEEV